MADIELVIKIPEEIYSRILERNRIHTFDNETVCDAIKNGTSLPKDHGRLIDADELRCEREDFDTYFDYSNAFDVIYYAPTIIKANMVEREEK